METKPSDVLTGNDIGEDMSCIHGRLSSITYMKTKHGLTVTEIINDVSKEGVRLTEALLEKYNLPADMRP